MALTLGTSTAVANANESAANTETVVGQIVIPNVGGAGQSAVLLVASATITPAASVTSITLRWRRTSLTGTAIRSSGALVLGAANSLGSFTFAAVDTIPGELSGAVYVFTYAGAGEGAAAAFNSFHGFGLAL